VAQCFPVLRTPPELVFEPIRCGSAGGYAQTVEAVLAKPGSIESSSAPGAAGSLAE